MTSMKIKFPASRLKRIASIMTVAITFTGCATPTVVTPTSTPEPTATTEVPASALDPFAQSSSFLSYEDLSTGFRIDYPSDWTVDASQISSVAIEFPASIGQALGVRAGFFIVGTSLEEVGVTSLDELWASFAASLSDQVLVDPPANIEHAGIVGYQAPFLDLEIEAQGWLMTFIVGEQGYVIITLVQPAVHYETFQPVFEAMLESLEFLPPAPSP